MGHKRGVVARGTSFQADIVKLAGEVGIDIDPEWLKTINREQRVKVYEGLKAKAIKLNSKSIA